MVNPSHHKAAAGTVPPLIVGAAAKLVDAATAEGKALCKWRADFFELCASFAVLPAEACFNFGFNIAGVSSVALSTTHPQKVKRNIDMATKQMPVGFWDAMVQKGLLDNIDFFKK